MDLSSSVVMEFLRGTSRSKPRLQEIEFCDGSSANCERRGTPK
jgi:hypothetical protein